MSTSSNSIVSKSSKWFSNKGLKLSFGSGRDRKSKSSLNSLGSSSPNSPISTPKSSRKTREVEFKEVFRYFDIDGDGKISAFELRNFFGSIGEYISIESCHGVIKDHDTDDDNLLSFDEFVKLMMKREGEEDDELKRAFEMFEHEKGAGCITPKGLQKMLNRLGDEKSYEECVAMIHVFDIDGNGVLDFNEFNQMMA